MFHDLLSLLFFALLPFTVASPVNKGCNGNVALCDRKYSNVSQIGSHDSAFVGPLPTDNQDVSVTAQLESGIRFLSAQTHVFLGILSLCHTSCFELYAGSLNGYLGGIKSFLDSHPSEVVTLLLTNDGASINLFDAAFTTSGLKKYAFVPQSTPNVLSIDAWPTLQGLINANSRLVVFLDSGADMKNVPYILDEFSYFFETPFDTTDPNFSQCALDRPANSSPHGKMYIVNHFLDVALGSVLIPARSKAGETNADVGVGSIGAQAALCSSTYGRAPNFILVDFSDQGQVFQAQAALNGFN